MGGVEDADITCCAKLSSGRPSVRPAACPPVRLSSRPACQFARQPDSQAASQSVKQSVRQPASQSLTHSLTHSLSQSVSQSVRAVGCLSVLPSCCRSVSLSFHRRACLAPSASLRLLFSPGHKSRLSCLPGLLRPSCLFRPVPSCPPICPCSGPSIRACIHVSSKKQRFTASTSSSSHRHTLPY